MTDSAPSNPAPANLPVAEFGTRFSAFMIDAVVLFAVQWMVFIVLSRQLQSVGMTSIEPCAPGSVQFCEGPSTLLWAILLVVLFASTIGYHAVFEGLYGATPGKRWMGLCVVDAHGRSPIGLMPGLLRSLFRQAFWVSLFFVLDASPLAISLPAPLFIIVPLCCFALVAFGAVAPDGLGVHDRIAGTKVVQTDQLIASPGTASTHLSEEENSEESV